MLDTAFRSISEDVDGMMIGTGETSIDDNDRWQGSMDHYGCKWLRERCIRMQPSDVQVSLSGDLVEFNNTYLSFFPAFLLLLLLLLLITG
jgi:hypothetical protein